MTSISTAGGGVKSIQSGVYSGAGGTISITAIDTAKSIITTVSKSSAGTVASSGSVTGTMTPSLAYQNLQGMSPYTTSNLYNKAAFYFPDYTGTRSISGGTTALITEQYSAVITNSTTLTADGPVEWQVIEYT